MKAFSDQLAFRHRFGQAFGEVAEALRPRTLLILVDDLDRCRPEQVVETLEAINFLVNAGSCYVVIGIAPEQVMHCVGLGFKDIAAEMAPLPDSEKDPDEWARRKRQEFARNYLEKLINVEVSIPVLTDEDALHLTDSIAAESKPVGLPGTLRPLALVGWPWALLGIMVVFAAAVVLLRPPSEGPRVPTITAGTMDGEGGFIPPPVFSASPDAGFAQNVAETTSVTVAAARVSAHREPPEWPVEGILGLMVLALCLVLWWRIRHSEDQQIEDSPIFKDALRIWSPLVRARVNSPRELKRFANQVRYLSMVTGGGTLLGRSPPSESLIVALTALQGVARTPSAGGEERSRSLPPGLVQLLATTEQGSVDEFAEEIDQWVTEAVPTAERDRFLPLLKAALAKHRETFPGEAVNEDLLRRFHIMASGIMVR